MCGILLETGRFRFWKLCFRQVSVKRQDKMVVILYICIYIYFSFKSNNKHNVIGMFPFFSGGGGLELLSPSF